MSKFSFEEMGAVTVSFAADTGVKGGQVVKVTGNGTVGPCAAGDAFCGVALAPRNGAAAVQVRGFTKVSRTGQLNLGWVELVADGQGGVKAAEAPSVTVESGSVTLPSPAGVRALVVSTAEDGTAVLCL